MKKCILQLLIVLLSFAACRSNIPSYTGSKIEIDYSNVEKINDGSWIKIDHQKFVHVRDRRKAANVKFSLPTATILFDSLNTGKAFRTKVDLKSIPLYLSRYLDTINRNEASSKQDKKTKYRIINPALSSIEGKIQIAKSDSGDIKIMTSKDYPAKITVLSR